MQKDRDLNFSGVQENRLILKRSIPKGSQRSLRLISNTQRQWEDRSSCLRSSRQADGTYSALVAPHLLSPEHPLYSVNDVFNAVFVHGNVLGDAMFYGSGAGKLPTASAVVADVVEMAKHLDQNIPVEWSKEELPLADYKKNEKRFFVRTEADEAAVKAVFGEVELVHADGISGEMGFVTGNMTEAAYEEKAAKLGKVLQMIRLA